MDTRKIIDDLFTASPFSQVNIIMMQRSSINEAIVCDQLEQWSNYYEGRHELQDGYFYKTYEELCEDTGLTKKQVVRAVEKLEEKYKLLHTDLTMTNDGKKVKWYKVDFKAIDKFIAAGDGTVSKNTSSDRFIIYNKKLAQKIGPVSTILIRDMAVTYAETAKMNNLIDGEWFPCKQTKLSKKCGVTTKTMCQSYIKNMIKQGLIEIKKAGWTNQTYAKIDFNRLTELMGYGVGSEYENLKSSDSFFYAQNNETIPEVERITRKILAHVEKISGQKWDFNYVKMAAIEARLEEGFTEDDFIAVIDHMYAYYMSHEKHFDKYFTWQNLVGTKSKLEDWLKKIERDQEKEEEKLYAEKVAYTLYNKMLEHSGGKIQYEIDSTKIDLIRKRLSEELTEDELIEHMISRYDHLKEHGYDVVKNCSWNKLFGSKCFDEIQTVRNIRLKESVKKNNFKFNKQYKTAADRDPATIKGDNRGRFNQEDLRRRAAAGEIEVF